LYDTDEVSEDFTSVDLLDELRDTKMLLVVDDFDTVSEDEDLSEFLLHNLRNTSARVIFTSRHRVQGMRHLEIGPFADDELSEFVNLRAIEYGADRAQCLRRLRGIKSVTSGYPLFVDDLIHHAAIIGVDTAMKDWSQKRGDAAREYALQRQVAHLGRSCGDVLIALSVGNRPLFPTEISNIAGLTDEDAIGGLQELLRWRIVSREIADTGTPQYTTNANTRRLVQKAFRDDNRFPTYSAAFRALTGERVPEAKMRAIRRVMNQASDLYRRGSFKPAIEFIKENMVGELNESAELYGLIGRLYSRQVGEDDQLSARRNFERSHQLGSRNTDTYFHWMLMEKDVVENLTRDANPFGGKDLELDDKIASRWRVCEKICEDGIERCGESRLLCYWAGYAACREAKSRERTGKYAYSQGSYERSVEWYRRSLRAQVSDISPVKIGSIWRGITIAYDGIGNAIEVKKALLEWYSVSGSDAYFDAECGRMIRKYPVLQGVQEFRYLLVLSPTF
jgi:hypothetical protein